MSCADCITWRAIAKQADAKCRELTVANAVVAQKCVEQQARIAELEQNSIDDASQIAGQHDRIAELEGKTGSCPDCGRLANHVVWLEASLRQVLFAVRQSRDDLLSADRESVNRDYNVEITLAAGDVLDMADLVDGGGYSELPERLR